MKRTSKLTAAVLLTMVAACQDGATDPASDNIDDAPVPPAATASVQAVQRDADGTVIYSVRVTSSSHALSSFQGTVQFAPGAFDLQSQTPAPVSNGMVIVNTNDFDNGRIRFASYTATTYAADGEGVEVFRFVVRPATADEPPVSASLQVVGITNSTSSPASAALVEGSEGECTGSSLWGDGNADDFVNITDAQQLARYAAGLPVANEGAVTTRGDVTADGSVNIVDAQQVARYSVGLTAAARTNTWICN